MPVPFVLDYVLEKLAEPTDKQRLLKQLTGTKLKALEARAVWERILDHKWYISERLGRDVGFRVAAVDYLENIWTPSSKPDIGWLTNRFDRVGRATTLTA